MGTKNRWTRLYLIQGIGAVLAAVLTHISITSGHDFLALLGLAIFVVFGILGWISFFRR